LLNSSACAARGRTKLIATPNPIYKVEAREKPFKAGKYRVKKFTANQSKE
jgi:hypothetical protein